MSAPGGWIDSGELVARLRRYVGIDSTNPGAHEAELATLIASELAAAAVETHIVEHAPGRPGVVGVVDSGFPGPRLVLNGHMDTVPFGDRSDWTSDPLAATVRSGRIVGRGACDMKAGLAIQAEIAAALAGRLTRGALVVHFAAGEETAEPGTRSLLAAGFGGDYGIVTEPTSLQVAVAERGAAFVRIAIAGHGGHGGRPDRADSPVDRIGPVLDRIAAYAESLRGTRHRLLGSPTCTPTMVAAGIAPNVIPDTCEIVVDRRLLPGETANEAAAQIECCMTSLPELGPCGVKVELMGEGFAPCEISPTSPIVDIVQGALERVAGRRPSLVGTPFASDVRNLVLDGGIEAVTFGPGSIDQAHQPDEWIEISEVTAAAEVLLDATRTLLA